MIGRRRTTTSWARGNTIDRWGERYESDHRWGPDDESESRAAFGTSVVDDLAAGLIAHSETVRRPVVLGCVPWLTSIGVASALCQQQAVCIVVDKRGTDGERGIYRAVRKLISEGRPISNEYLPGFDLVTRRVEGQRAVLGPSDFPVEELELGPVRVGGWYGPGNLPILHAKMAVCCNAWIGEDDFGYERSGLTAVRTWTGSANWTENSSRHTEVGLWIDDRAFAAMALDFIVGLIRDSEPMGSRAREPMPELAEADLDDDAFAEYAAEFGHFDEEDSDDQDRF